MNRLCIIGACLPRSNQTNESLLTNLYFTNLKIKMYVMYNENMERRATQMLQQNNITG